MYKKSEQSKIIEIEVDGKFCEIVFKQTGITSTGASIGHEAVNLNKCRLIK